MVYATTSNLNYLTYVVQMSLANKYRINSVVGGSSIKLYMELVHRQNKTPYIKIQVMPLDEMPVYNS